MCALRYDDSNLRKLYAALSPANRKKALKGAFRKTGNSIKKVAISNLRASGLHHAELLSKGVRTVVFRREAGFRVTVASRKANKSGKGERGMHTNRRGLKKPILIWAEAGTKWRRSNKATKYPVGSKWRTGRTRGFMPRYGFMQKTKQQVEHKVDKELKDEIIVKMRQIAKKYGCEH